MNWNGFAALVRKDLLLFFMDRRSLMMSFAAPIAIASFFGFVLGGSRSRSEAARIPVWLVDEDHSTFSNALGRRLAEEKSLGLRTGGAAEARDAVRSGRAAAAVILPQGFGDKAGRALFGPVQKPDLQLLFDPSRVPEREMVKGVLTGHVMQVVGQQVFGGGESSREVARRARADLRRANGLPAEDRKALDGLLESVEKFSDRPRSAAAGEGGGLSVPYKLAEEAVTARAKTEYNSFAHAFTGMGVQFILFMGIEAGVMILVQRQRGLWKRLRAAPLSKFTLLGSRAVSAAIAALIILAVLFGFARIVFGVKVEGSWIGFIGVAVAFSLMTASFGLLVAAVGKTPEGTRPVAILATLIMVMLGGSWVPSFLFPAWLQTATKAVPTRWAVDGLNAMTWRGLGLSEAVAPIAVLLGFALLFGALAANRFEWETGD